MTRSHIELSWADKTTVLVNLMPSSYLFGRYDFPIIIFQLNGRRFIHFLQILGWNIFLTIFLEFFTSQNWNYQILMKIEQKLALYF